MSPADTSLQGESKDPEHSNQQGASTPEVDEQSVIGTPTPLDATLLRQVAEILATGYVRLLASLAVDPSHSVPPGYPRISLDLSSKPSDELDRQQRPRRPRCKQI